MDQDTSYYHTHKSSIDDEISLVDIAVGVWKHRWFGLLVFCGVLALGITVALVKSKAYLYTTVIELGEIGSGGIEPPATVKAKLENAYIPAAARKIDLPANMQSSSLAVDVKLITTQGEDEKPAKLVVLQSEAPESKKSVYIALHEAAAQALVADHSRDTNFERSELVNKLKQANLRLSELQDPATLTNKLATLNTKIVGETISLQSLRNPDIFNVDRQELEKKITVAKAQLKNYDDQAFYVKTVIKNLEKTESLLSSQIVSSRAYIEEAKARSLELTATGEKDNAMALLLLDTKLQNSIDQTVALEQRLYTGIPNKRIELNNHLTDIERQRALQVENIQLLESQLQKWVVQHQQSVQRQVPVVDEVQANLSAAQANFQRDIENQKLAIAALQARIDYIQPTHLVSPPQQSLKPTGIGTLVMIAISVVLAGFLALAAALLAAFLEAVKTRLATMGAPSEASGKKETTRVSLAHPKKYVHDEQAST